MPEPQGDPQTFGRIFGEPARFEQMPRSPSHSMHTPRGMTPVVSTPGVLLRAALSWSGSQRPELIMAQLSWA
eukprot:8413600-Pyramimonas_sp.AAC.1